MIEYLDRTAAESRFREIHPGEKAFFSLGSLIMVLGGDSLPLSLCTLILMLGLLARLLPPQILLLMILIPAAFVVTGLIPLLISLSTRPIEGGFPLIKGALYGKTGRESLLKGLSLLGKSSAAVSCFYLLIVTTPAYQIDWLMGKMKVPPLFRELFLLVYRFIFVLARTADKTAQSMRMRGGFISFRKSLNSLAHLGVSLLIKGEQFTARTDQALRTRGWEGSFPMGEKAYKGNRKYRVLIALHLFLMLLIALTNPYPRIGGAL